MTRRKGKPRAKTKEGLDSSVSGRLPVNRDKPTEEESEPKLDTEVLWFPKDSRSIVRETQSEIVSNEARNAQHPVVTINVELDRGLSDLGGTSAVVSKAELKSETRTKKEKKGDILDEIVGLRSSFSSRLLSMGSSHCLKSETKRQPLVPEEQADVCDGVENVRANFVSLIHYNKIQYLLVSALVYSVINLIIYADYIIDGPSSGPYASGKLEDIRYNRTIQFFDQRMGRKPSWQESNNYQSNFVKSNPSLQTESHGVSSAFILVLLLLPLSLIMFIVITLIMIEFNSIDWHSLTLRLDKNNIVVGRPKRYSCLELFGILLASILLMWPIYLQQFVQLGWVDFCPGKCFRGKPVQVLYQPVAALMVTLYPFFTLLKGTNPSTRLIFCAAYLPSLLMQARIMIENDNPSYRRVSLCLMVAALAGAFLRRRLLSNTLGKTFDGTNELIEAKVSLEQQRQQQETLLLSVLPAYVAEQVKRNMVKKMNSVDSADTPTQAEVLQSQAGVNLIVTTNSSGQQQTTSLVEEPNHSISLSNSRDKSLTRSASIKATSGGQTVTSINSTLAAPLNAARLSAVGFVTGYGKQGKNEAKQSTTWLTSGTLHPTSNFVQPPGQARRGFNELYIRTYNNVSLLYGDIVGFTRLCTQLSSSQLVRVLNDLFSYFDHLAEQHKIMRIKILGDCYYGVSGIPEFAVMGAKRAGPSYMHHSTLAPRSTPTGAGGDNHATNCVNMGLDMIKYIKCLNVERKAGVREEIAAGLGGQSLRLNQSSNRLITSTCTTGACPLTSTGEQNCNRTDVKIENRPTSALLPAFELNMRIGIHTGHIHSGVIGLKKWQFDVWSNDVSIAMHCESSGVAGRVQVTEATVQHLHGSFPYEPAPKSNRDSYLADKDIKTYLICDRETSDSPDEDKLVSGSEIVSNEGKKGGGLPRSFNELLQCEQTMDEMRIRAATIGTIKQILLAGETANSCSKNGIALALDHNDLSPFSLRMTDHQQESMFNRRPISRAGYLSNLLLIAALLIFTLQYFDKQWSKSAGILHNEAEIELSGDVRVLLALIGLMLLLAIGISSFRYRNSSSFANSRNSLSSKYRTSSGRRSSQQGSVVEESPELGEESGQGYVGKRGDNPFVKGLIDKPVKIARSMMICVEKKIRDSAFEQHNSNWTSFALVSMFFIVILGQTIQSYENYCRNDQLTESLLNLLFHQQVTVILFVITLELTNSSLLSYKLRSILILATSLLYLILLVKSLSLIRNHPKPSIQDSGETKLRFEGCAKLMHYIALVSEEDDTSNDDEAGNNVDRVQLDEVHSTLNELYMMTMWSSSLLTLILAFWSLSFMRKIEYSRRCNFLWRNKLNVDHEELEYISGINKVLLENILPSHVVQHYLAQPKSCQSREKKTRNQRRSRPSDNCQTTAGQLSSVNCNRNDLIRMSISQMRGLSSSHLAAATGSRTGGLYHEQHDSVAVMFASIPHFYEFYDESDISKQGLGCIALLNEIICDFDKLLLKNKFSRIEKIKTIGSTYMAAAGLRPTTGAQGPLSAQETAACGTSSGAQSKSDQTGTGSFHNKSPPGAAQNANQDSGCQANLEPTTKSPEEQRRPTMSQEKMNLICMIQFATTLMSTLNGINKQSFQVFKLRVGVNTGPVIAGIIGAQRPFYDIWGDCVNVRLGTKSVLLCRTLPAMLLCDYLSLSLSLLLSPTLSIYFRPDTNSSAAQTCTQIASRMESLGEVGRIQVEEKTAKLLMECLCTESKFSSSQPEAHAQPNLLSSFQLSH